jgi:hypothetical protein
MLRLAAELVDHVGGRAPVGIDKTPLDLEVRPIFPPPFAAEQVIHHGLQPGIDCPLQPRAFGCELERRARRPYIMHKADHPVFEWVPLLHSDRTLHISSALRQR